MFERLAHYLASMFLVVVVDRGERIPPDQAAETKTFDLLTFLYTKSRNSERTLSVEFDCVVQISRQKFLIKANCYLSLYAIVHLSTT